MLESKGEMQEGKVGKALQPFEVVVTDEEGRGVPHVPIEFRIAEGSGKFTYVDDRTDLRGHAIAEFVPSDAGRFRVECHIGEEKREIVPFKGVIAAGRGKRASRPAKAAETVNAPKAAVSPPPPPPADAPSVAAPTTPAPTAAKAPAAAVRSAPAPKIATRSQTRPRPKVASPPFPRGLLIAVIVIYALLAAFSIILICQEPRQTRPVVECSGAWRIDGNYIVFQKCIATTR